MSLILVPRHTGLVFFSIVWVLQQQVLNASTLCTLRQQQVLNASTLCTWGLRKIWATWFKVFEAPFCFVFRKGHSWWDWRGGLFQERMKVLGCKRGSFLMISHKITYLVKWSSQGTLRCLEVPLGILGDIYWFIVQTSEGQFGQAIKRQLRQSKTSQRELRHLR